ncbi:unnamed protein product [Adineta steineri]|uniref:ZP-C domain-containing protein n=1 Tax=Adineta steineri TaxID=433720 RepID=A0A815FZV8_9BILA|nr:unnamed protein product [Adineta steineri]CAF3969074.1 unnamed protein product [Adineta steineri]
MYKLGFFIFIVILWSLSLIDAKRRVPNESQHNLGDFCIPGTCTSLNSNCKRVGGTAFRCVCKEQYMSVNKTHCVRVINASIDSICTSCIERGGVCLDENTDDHMDKCFCQTDSDLCNGITSSSSITSVTQPLRKNIPIVTPLPSNQSNRRGELILTLFDITQQHSIDNSGSVSVGNRLFIDIKYRTAEHNTNRHQIIAENCSIASSVSDNEIKLEKISLLTNRCPSLDSRLPIRFQRMDPDHIKSTIFQIQKFDTTSIVYLRCSIAICHDRIENCQERLCPETRRSSNILNSSLTSSTDSAPFDYIDEDGESVIALRRRKRTDSDEEQTKNKLARLLSDLTWSMDQPSSTNQLEDNNPTQYEVRQIQQQFTIEVPRSQSTHKHKAIYDALYSRSSLIGQGAVERSTVIATISIIFIIGISISLFVVYRTCHVEYTQRIYGSSSFAGFGNGNESIYGGIRGPSQVCRYDMGRRSEQRFDESFFVSNVEPLGAYRRQY